MSDIKSDLNTAEKQAKDDPSTRAKKLAALHGIGDILARRLVEAGHDSFAKIAAAGEAGLKSIPGINQRLVPAILRQAEELAQGAKQGKAEALEEMRTRVRALKTQIQDLAQATKERFNSELSGPVGAKLEKEIGKALSSLEKVESKLEGRVKQAGKGLRKAEKRLEGLAEAGLKKVGKGLKRARKSLKRVYS